MDRYGEMPERCHRCGRKVGSFGPPEKEEQAYLVKYLRELGAREREILRARWSTPRDNLAAIGLRFGLRRERVRQLERDSVHRLRKVAYAAGSRW